MPYGRWTNYIVETSGKWKKSSIRKVLTVLFRHLWEIELTYRYFFSSSSSSLKGVSSLIMIPLFAVGVIDTGGKYSTSVVDTSSKFAAGMSLILVVHLDLRISSQIFKTI
jgi:hypothetical protein